VKSAFIKTILLATLATCSASLHAKDRSRLSYSPAVVTLTGTVFEESYGDDPPSERYRGYHAWILRLERPISIRGIPGDPLTPEARNVKEVQLNVDHATHPIRKRAFGKTRFVATGELYQPGTSFFLRPVVLAVTTLKAGPHLQRL
jgi:hypothetical protein